MLFVAVILGVPGVAQGAVHTLAPAIIDAEIQPRDIVDEKLVLVNTSDYKIKLFPIINDVTAGEDGGVQQFVSPSMADRTRSLASWLEVARGGEELAPHEKREVILTIRVGPQAKPGEYHAMIAYAPGSTIDDAQRLVDAHAVPITFINATLADKKVDSVNLSRFYVKQFVIQEHVGDMTYRVDNTGDTELIPTGDVVIYNQRGEEVASIPVNPEKRSVQAGDSTTFTASVPVSKLLGKYKAYLTLHYGAQQAAVNDTVYFFAVPWKKVLIAFVIFIVLALTLALVVHHRYRKRDDDASYEEFYATDPDEAVALPLTLRDNLSTAHHRDVVMKHGEK